MVTAIITIAMRPEIMEVAQIHFLLLRTLLLEETIPPVSPVSRLTLFLSSALRNYKILLSNFVRFRTSETEQSAELRERE